MEIIPRTLSILAVAAAVMIVNGMTTSGTTQSTMNVTVSTEVVTNQNTTGKPSETTQSTLNVTGFTDFVASQNTTANVTLLSGVTTPSGNGSTMVTSESTMNVTVSTQFVTSQGTTDMNNTTTSEGMYDTTTANISIFNCSHPGQECLNGTCTSRGLCNCSDNYIGDRCETYLACPEDYCFQQGTENCTAFRNGTYRCNCKYGYSGESCNMFDGCMSSPCLNNGTCESTNSYGHYKCNCTTGDPKQNCLLNEQNECFINPPNSQTSYITCVDQIGSRKLYCAPGHNGSECRDIVADDDYCDRHGCENSTYCKPLCNVEKCNETDVCRSFTALANLRSTLLYDYTECPKKFANGYGEHECRAADGLFDGFDGNRLDIRDCSPFFDTICTESFADDICNPACDNMDCMYDGGDCMQSDANASEILPGFTVIKFAQLPLHKKQLATKLSLFSRSKVEFVFSEDFMQVGLKIEDSEFPNIAIASKFFAAAIGKIPGLVDYVTDVYACQHGKYNNGSQSVCGQNCSSTCKQEGNICNWSNGTCRHGCQSGYWGEYCEKMCSSTCNGSCTQKAGHCIACPDGKYGTYCNMDCDNHCTLSKCNISDGECDCAIGKFWSRNHLTCVDCNEGCIGDTCKHKTGQCVCKDGYYGVSCSNRCSENCAGISCNETGACTGGCKDGYHGTMCDQTCDFGCSGGTCLGNGICKDGCKVGYHGDMCNKKCSAGCMRGTCSRTGNCADGCKSGYHGDMCNKKCSAGCIGRTCSRTGDCADGCQAGYHGNMCNKHCPTGCASCERTTGECLASPDCKPGQANCEKQEQEQPEENNTGVIVAIVIAVIIVLLIILIAIICWRRKQSGDYIVEDEEEMQSPVMKATTLEVKTNSNLQPVSPYMGRPTDMIDMDEKQEAGVYTGPQIDSKTDLVDRNPDGKSTKSEDSKSSASSSDDEKKPKGDDDDEEPATGEGAPMGRKRSSLKITLSREKQPVGEMSPKSPQLIVINDKTGEVLSPLKIDDPEKSAFEMPETPLKHTMAPLASEEDLLSDIGPKPTENDQTNVPATEGEEMPLIDEEEDEKTKRSSSSSDKRSSKRSSSSSDGKKSKKSRSSSSSSSENGSDLDEKISEYDENKEKITEM